MEKIDVLETASRALLDGNTDVARKSIQTEYPFQMLEASKRTYTDKQKMEQFKKDGFIDRYSGQKLVNPGILKVLSYYLPEDFPYHPHWKMEACHNAYWEFVPTVDHIYPVALGGADSEENWATTSMLHNSIKSNWTLDQLQWKLYDAGRFEDWDGLTGLFVKLVEKNDELLKDSYIRRWYKISP
jgi:hypothetical protein